MTRNKLGRLLMLSALLLGSSSLAAGSLVYGMSAEPTSLESGNVNDTSSALAHAQIYDTLVGFAPGTTTLAPALATSWVGNKDATQWTFFLRKNVTFQDGTPFNADAVLFNVNRWWDPAAASNGRDNGRLWQSWTRAFGGFKGDPQSLLKSVRKVDPYKVVFTLARPFADFPGVIGSAFFGIASPTAVRKAGANYGTPAGGAVGTGPFSFENWVSGDHITLSANKAYWQGAPQVDRLTLRFIKDPSARLNELRAGTVDFTSDLTPDDLKGVQATSTLTAVIKPSFNVGFLSMNTASPMLKDVRVRQAISMAINKKAVVSAFFGKLGVSDASFLPPALKWANSRKVPGDYRYDPAGAKKLLADAGFPNGLSIDLWYMPVSRPYFPNPKPIAEAMAADLSTIGIKVNLKTEDWTKYLADRNKAPGFDLYMIGWTPGNGSPYDFYSAYYGAAGSADSNYAPASIETLLSQAQAATTKSQKASVYGQLHDLTYNAFVRLPIVHSSPLGASRTTVKGWKPSPLGTESFVDVSVDGK